MMTVADRLERAVHLARMAHAVVDKQDHDVVFGCPEDRFETVGRALATVVDELFWMQRALTAVTLQTMAPTADECEALEARRNLADLRAGQQLDAEVLKALKAEGEGTKRGAKAS